MPDHYIKAEGQKDMTDLFIFICEEVLFMHWVEAKRKFIRYSDTLHKDVTFRELARFITNIKKAGYDVDFELKVFYKKTPDLKDIRETRKEKLVSDDNQVHEDEIYKRLNDQAKEIKKNIDIVPKTPGEVKMDEVPPQGKSLTLPAMPSFLNQKPLT